MESRLPPTPNISEVLRRLAAYAKPHWLIVVGSLVAAALQAGADAVVPLLMAAVVEQLQSGERTVAAALRIPLLIALIFPFRGAMDFLATYGLNWVGRTVVRTLRSGLFGQYLALPARYIDAESTGALISKMTFNTEQVPEAIIGALIVLVRDSLTVVLLIGMMLYLSPMLTLVIAVVAPVVWLLVKAMSKALRRYSARIQQSMGDFTEVLQQALSDHRSVKIFEGRDFEQQRFAQVNRRNRRFNIQLAAINALGSSLTQWVVALGVAAVMLAAMSNTLGLGVDASVFVGFIAAMGMLLAPLKRLTGINALMQRAVVAAASVFDTLDQPTERDTGTLTLTRARGDVEYRNVSFRYDESRRPALQNVDISIHAGSRVALVGHSGSGKSTLLGLLARFYEVEDGSILLDGTDIRDYRLRDLRRQLSLVSQDVFVFDESLANNIAYGASETCSRDEIDAAAETAGLTEFAATLPDGLDTRIGERGGKLSGGQRQRVSIARALLKDAPVLLLDEATSALDTETEQLIQSALDRLMADRTTLVVAHRLSTIRAADRIVVMHDGAVVETGSHDVLLAQGGRYAELLDAHAFGAGP